MIGLVIVAHGTLAAALLHATEHVVGAQSNAIAIAIGPNDDLRGRQAEIDEAVDSVNDGSGVVVVTDMFGGTPSNLAHATLTGDGVEVVYGASLPLLVKLAKMRDKPLADAVEAATAAGRKYMSSAGSILAKQKPA